MKAAILTIQSINYGNRLQNYALQTALESEGCSVETLRREPYTAKKKIRRALRRVLKNDAFTRFLAFDRSYIHFSDHVVTSQASSPGLASAYDAFIIGSDQVWNPTFEFNSEAEYLPEITSSVKIAYAASFGVADITANRSRTAELLNGVGPISMREEAGARIVKSLTGREIPVVLDPTMLLSADAWGEVSARPKNVVCDKPYVFKYVLGDDANETSIAKLADERGLQIIDVKDISLQDPSLKLGPSEFVWLIAHSDLVCTDSFHASVFALLHHKPLAVFERVDAGTDMSSRFDTLCSLFNLTGHRSSESSFGADSIYGTDWDAFEARLAELRAFSLGWLGDALKEVAHG